MSDQPGFALVTGASRGIGAAILARLSDDGYPVVGTATTPSGVATIDHWLAERGRAGSGCLLDFRSATLEDIDEVVKNLEQRWGPVSVLVNNAGITRDDLLLRMTEALWDEVIEVDLSAVFRLTKACLRGMLKARGGAIINLTSVVALSGNPGQVNYAAAKGGVLGFTRSLAQEVGSRGVRVNAVAPGLIDTDMTRDMTPEQKSQLMQRIPLRRLGKVEEVAACISFLASPGAAYITGETLQVNGGMYMS
ncbi:3-ketoacyl-(acyl-carrier-protein) reductase [mine drainage metagenome]|uniref:3-ketoacyl-(Acyl-carrier-protein) reductase n=1 Tax=mine drainage metagenome TaxID=410659 RepID=T1BC76_9ZZZZ